MKRLRNGDRLPRSSKKNRHERARTDSQITELLKMCLQRVCEMQADLNRNADYDNDAEAAGYAACAMETLRFLSAEGLSLDHPVVKGLTKKILEDKD